MENSITQLGTKKQAKKQTKRFVTFFFQFKVYENYVTLRSEINSTRETLQTRDNQSSQSYTEYKGKFVVISKTMRSASSRVTNTVTDQSRRPPRCWKPVIKQEVRVFDTASSEMKQ